MENTNRLELAIDASASTFHIDGIESRAEFGLEMLCETLQALGLAADVSEDAEGGQRLVVAFPEPHVAHRAMHRGGGRPKAAKAYIVDDAGFVMSDREALAWLESHSVEDGMERMGGVSRRTYYRKLAQLRDLCQ